MKYKSLDCVVLERDMPSLGLRKGDVGAVVHVHSPEDLEVEFVTPAGRTVAVVTLKMDDVRPVTEGDRISDRNGGRRA